MRIHSVFHAFMLQCCNQFIPLQIIETFVEPDKEYKVKDILEKQMISEKTHYLVKWREYNTSENMWKPRENLKNCARALWHLEKER